MKKNFLYKSIKNEWQKFHSKKTNKISIFLIYAFFSEFLLDKGKKKILMGEYIKLSKDFLTTDEVKYFNFLLDDIAQKAP